MASVMKIQGRGLSADAYGHLNNAPDVQLLEEARGAMMEESEGICAIEGELRGGFDRVWRYSR